jgi:hypothetical protein
MVLSPQVPRETTGVPRRTVVNESFEESLSARCPEEPVRSATVRGCIDRRTRARSVGAAFSSTIGQYRPDQISDLASDQKALIGLLVPPSRLAETSGRASIVASLDESRAWGVIPRLVGVPLLSLLMRR